MKEFGYTPKANSLMRIGKYSGAKYFGYSSIYQKTNNNPKHKIVVEIKTIDFRVQHSRIEKYYFSEVLFVFLNSHVLNLFMPNINAKEAAITRTEPAKSLTELNAIKIDIIISIAAIVVVTIKETFVNCFFVINKIAKLTKKTKVSEIIKPNSPRFFWTIVSPK